MEVGGYRLRERKEKPVRLLPLYWYQLPDSSTCIFAARCWLPRRLAHRYETRVLNRGGPVFESRCRRLAADLFWPRVLTFG